MSKRIRILLCALLVTAMVFTAFVITSCAGSVTISYAFSGDNASEPGYAEGTITVYAGASDGGNYFLYWSDDTAALSGYSPIATLSVPASGSAAAVMPEFTAIPATATKIIAFHGNAAAGSRTVKNADAVFSIPADKLLNKTHRDLLYSFASYSDFHISADRDGSSQSYPYDEEHLYAAFNIAASRGVDFIATSGDHVTNQRNDPNGGNNNFYAEEWNTYLKILADSQYTGKVYEAIGNHELWNFDTETEYIGNDWHTGYDYFIRVSGLDSDPDTMSKGKAYYEITEPVTGDHFLFMALEGGFYTDRVEEFSPEQLDWLESKLQEYNNDGKNTFIFEHANFSKWGAGDQLDNPIYDIPLMEVYKKGKTTVYLNSTSRLKNLLKTYKNAVFVCGHTHFKFDLQLNYSTNGGTSATIIHNSSVGGVRNILDHTTRVNDKSLQNTEGYIVEVYDDATIFYGTNLYNNLIIPSCTYIIKQSTSPLEERPTEAPTDDPSHCLRGDADDDSEISILDATCIQRYLALLIKEDRINMRSADADLDGVVSILDATRIQRFLAQICDMDGNTPSDHQTVASTGNSSDIAPIAADTELEPASANLNTLRSQARSALDKYWMLSSYDQYMALKRAYKENNDYNTLNKAYTEFSAAVSSFYPGDTIDVYFRNDNGWSSVYAYAYNDGNDYNASWPGTACTKVSGKIWRIRVPIGKYNYIIFNNGSGIQTNDLALGITNNQGYYPASAGSRVDAKQFVYGSN